MFYIYCYENKINGKCYVGQTNNTARRKREHKSNAFNEKSKGYSFPFYKAIRKYGVDFFKFYILEEIEDKENVNKIEKYWIEIKKSNHREWGYNLKNGGKQHRNTTILSEKKIDKIKSQIKEGIGYELIAKKYEVSISFLSNINKGEKFFEPLEKYPLYDYEPGKNNLKEIINLLEKSNLSLKEISEKMNISYSTIKKINSGDLNKITNRQYPIRVNSARYSSSLIIKNSLMKTNKTFLEIAKENKVSVATVSRINRGVTHRNNALKYPLRNNL